MTDKKDKKFKYGPMGEATKAKLNNIRRGGHLAPKMFKLGDRRQTMINLKDISVFHFDDTSREPYIRIVTKSGAVAALDYVSFVDAEMDYKKLEELLVGDEN